MKPLLMLSLCTSEVGLYGVVVTTTIANYMMAVIIPLYALQIELDYVSIGILIASRHAVSLFFSVLAGKQVDRKGTKYNLYIHGLLTAVLSLSHIGATDFAILIALQALLGFAFNVTWQTAQASVGIDFSASRTVSARMSTLYLAAATLGPLLGGLLWETVGAVGCFVAAALLGVAQLLFTRLLGAYASNAESGKRSGPGMVEEPKLSTLGLLSSSAISLVLTLTIVRMVGLAIQNSFLILYLQGTAYTATEISLIIGLTAAAGPIGSMLSERFARYVGARFLLTVSSYFYLLLIAITPLFGSIWVLCVAAILRGIAMGLGAALLIQIPAEEISRARQGVATAIRMTANRVSALCVPLLMGFVSETAGIEDSFFITGAVVLLITMPVLIYSGFNKHRAVPMHSKGGVE